MPLPALDSQTETLLHQLKMVTTRVFADELIGVYLHGSLALGSFDLQVSDLDYLIVVAQRPTVTQKLQLMQATFDELLPQAPAKGLEFHVLTLDAIQNGSHPFAFELHYSPMHTDAYINDPALYVKNMRGNDPDLAVHLAVTWQAGITLVGQPINQVFKPIPRRDYFNSAWGDIQNSEAEILDQPVYTLLNLCRLHAYLTDGVIRSKAEGGRWGLAHFNDNSTQLIDWALSRYGQTESSNAKPHAFAFIQFAKREVTTIHHLAFDQHLL